MLNGQVMVLVGLGEQGRDDMMSVQEIQEGVVWKWEGAVFQAAEVRFATICVNLYPKSSIMN